MINFLISYRETCLNQLNLGTSGGGRRVNESLEENEFLILAILSLKKVTNRSARPFLDSCEGSTVSGLECSAECKTCHSFLESLAFFLTRFIKKFALSLLTNELQRAISQ